MFVATALMSVFLVWGAHHFDWLHMHAAARAGLLAAMVAAAVLLYFGSLLAMRLRLRELLKKA